MSNTLASAFQLSSAQAQAIYAALVGVVTADGPAPPAAANLLRVAATTLALDPDAVPAARDMSVVAADLAAAVPDLAVRRAWVDGLVIGACIDGEVTRAGAAYVQALARAVGVRSHWVDLLTALRRRQTFAVKRQLVRRSPDARRLFARLWAEDGLRGLWWALRFVLGGGQDAALAARFRGLAALPAQTLGHQLFVDFTTRGLAFPGERGGIPERMFHHDLMHVINGYGTDAAGECELAGFYAGFCPGDAFTFIVIALATFQLGLPVSPAIVTPARGAFDPARVLAAFLRGRQLQVDVMGPWDYWSLMPLSLVAVRERLGLPT